MAGESVAREFYDALGMRESGGDYSAVNRFGYLGKYQMGELALIDAGYYEGDETRRNDWTGRWTGKDGVHSRQEFLDNPQAQENAVRAYHRRVWGYIRNAGLDRYVGQTVAGVPITPAAMLAGAHLLGVGGVRRFVESEGADDPVDGFGTPVSDYMKKFAAYDVSAITGPVAGDTRGTGEGGGDAGEPGAGGGGETGAPGSSDELQPDGSGGREATASMNGRREAARAPGRRGAWGTAPGDTPARRKSAMGGNVLINGRTAVHAGSGGVVTSPDVCKAGGKCRANAFTNRAHSGDASGTAGTVLVNGNPVCHKDSIFARSSGDEAGNCGGVRSGTIKGKAEFITFSPNVFIEGKPAVRQFDLMVSNNRNTPPMPLMQPGAAAPGQVSPEGGAGVDAQAPDDAGDFHLASDGLHFAKGTGTVREGDGS